MSINCKSELYNLQKLRDQELKSYTQELLRADKATEQFKRQFYEVTGQFKVAEESLSRQHGKIQKLSQLVTEINGQETSDELLNNLLIQVRSLRERERDYARQVRDQAAIIDEFRDMQVKLQQQAKQNLAPPSNEQATITNDTQVPTQQTGSSSASNSDTPTEETPSDMLKGLVARYD